MKPRSPKGKARHFTRQLDSLRLGLGAGEAALASPLYEKALRYERLVGRLENRIRVAMLRLVRATDR